MESERLGNDRAVPGWVVELVGETSSLYLCVSTDTDRFGWSPRIGQVLILAREEDAQALARYAQARAPEGTKVIANPAEWYRPETELERENDRLRRRIDDLESILRTLRRIRTAEIERASEESQNREEKSQC